MYTPRASPARSSFNSHAPVGARLGRVLHVSKVDVSIHTPPWGRDPRTHPRLLRPDVSIHTPPWGRDPAAPSPSPANAFQFTRPRGGAIIASVSPFSPSCFNSHAPVGARSFSPHRLHELLVSIHTPPWGRDRIAFYASQVMMFQFTRPRGGAM